MGLEQAFVPPLLQAVRTLLSEHCAFRHGCVEEDATLNHVVAFPHISHFDLNKIIANERPD